MSFDHQGLKDQFLSRDSQALEAIKHARETYGVRIVEAEVEPGATYWKVVGVYHLRPQENLGNHHVYFEALDEAGQRPQSPVPWGGWTWEGRGPDEPAPPIALDKPANEVAGNLAMFAGQNVSVWIKGLSPDANDSSDRVENLHILHPDERAPNGDLGNSIGHHSFYVLFQRTRKGAPTIPPPGEETGANNGVISGRIAEGRGYTVRLLRGRTIIAEQKVGDDLTFRFAGLPHGVYHLVATAPKLRQSRIKLDANNQQRTIELNVT